MESETILEKSLAKTVIEESKRTIFKEQLPWLKHCLGMLSVEEVWERPGRHIVSIGNLVLHIIGNSRQWIISGLGGAPDIRKRDDEFLEKGPIPTSDLMYRLDQTFSGVEAILDNLDPESLLDTRKVQDLEENAVGILLHVVEHFSYHVGQVSFAVKIMKSVK